MFAQSVDDTPSIYRKPVECVARPAEVLSSGGLRGSVTFSLCISGKSSITQEVILDADCPYIKFSTQVKKNIDCESYDTSKPMLGYS